MFKFHIEFSFFEFYYQFLFLNSFSIALLNLCKLLIFIYISI
ncbi:hypothetical protein BBUWI9123_E0023 (plasmid) [Borreliella burgdorferi WI91-23]|nr:hypothetical protein BBUWI9123_E0023 [Borreliella burgdorferi WI91-23]